MTEQSRFEIVSPVGDAMAVAPGGVAKRNFGLSPALASLEGKKIGLIWTVFTNGNILLEAFEDLLGKRFPTLSFVRMGPGRNAKWGDYPDLSLPDYAREQGIDAAIATAAC